MATQTTTVTAATTTIRPITPPIDAAPTAQTSTSAPQRIVSHLQTALRRTPGGSGGSGGAGNLVDLVGLEAPEVQEDQDNQEEFLLLQSPQPLPLQPPTMMTDLWAVYPRRTREIENSPEHFSISLPTTSEQI
jgi:hypothetical protein